MSETISAHLWTPPEPAAGLYGTSLQWNTGRLDFEDDEDREHVRAALSDAFYAIWGTKPKVVFSDEEPEI